ncbi:MAG: hypothetical protein OEV37_02995 [Candidatus Berkelbacteria bacterium]|nr:hypothetical protein [Candidatus Berkelbacteria bacterium]
MKKNYSLIAYILTLIALVLVKAAKVFAQTKAYTVIPDVPSDILVDKIIPDTLSVVSKSAPPLAVASIIGQTAIPAVSYILSGTASTSNLFPFLFAKRKKRFFGTVYNSVNKEPVIGAIVEIFDKRTNKVRERQVTNKSGQFGFIVNEGEFYIKARKNSFAFPSKLIPGKEDPPFDRIYHGEIIGSKGAEVVSANIPLDPQFSTKTPLIVRLNRFLERVRIPLMIIGTLSALYTFYRQPSTLNTIFVFAYALIWVWEFIITRKKSSWCETFDATTKKPIYQAIVRLVDNHNRILRTYITDQFGRFYPVLVPGRYRFQVLHPKYMAIKKEFEMTKSGQAKGIKIYVKKK